MKQTSSVNGQGKQTGLHRVLVLMLLAATPLKAENLASAWPDEWQDGWAVERPAEETGESPGLLIDQILISLAEDLRSNHLFLSSGPEQLRAILQRGLCVSAWNGCSNWPDTGQSGRLLTPAEVDLLLQHLSVAMQTHQMTLQQQQRLVWRLSLQGTTEGANRPVASR
jgi:hypothetical protein